MLMDEAASVNWLPVVLLVHFSESLHHGDCFLPDTSASGPAPFKLDCLGVLTLRACTLFAEVYPIGKCHLQAPEGLRRKANQTFLRCSAFMLKSFQ